MEMPDLINWDWRTTWGLSLEGIFSKWESDGPEHWPVVSSEETDCGTEGEAMGNANGVYAPLPQPQAEKRCLHWPRVSFDCSGFLSSLPPQPIHSVCSSGNWSSKTRCIIRDSRAREAGAGSATLRPWPRRATNKTQPTADCNCP